MNAGNFIGVVMLIAPIAVQVYFAVTWVTIARGGGGKKFSDWTGSAMEFGALVCVEAWFIGASYLVFTT